MVQPQTDGVDKPHGLEYVYVFINQWSASWEWDCSWIGDDRGCSFSGVKLGS